MGARLAAKKVSTATRQLAPVKRLRNLWLYATLSSLFSLKMQTVATAKPKYLLAFGDSLTEGYYDYGTRFHPYSIKLQQLFSDNGYNVKVDERGHSGERVIEGGRDINGRAAEWWNQDRPDAGMVSRLPLLLQLAESEERRYSWVVLLGGINDIAGWGADADNVFHGLQSLYDAARRHGANVMALTCMQTGMSRRGEAGNPAEGARRALNERIRGAAAKAEAAGDSGFVVLDLDTLLPFPADPADPAAALWDDWLHLSPAGYDKMGELIYEALRDKIEH